MGKRKRHDHKRVEAMKDVFTLIYPELVSTRESNYRAADHEERKPRVQQWLEDIIQKTSPSLEESAWCREKKRSRKTMSLLPRFMQLLRECMLTQRWTQILAMLDCVSHVPYGADWTTWKATLTTLYTEPEDNAHLIQDFFKHSYLLQECHARDVVLEFVHYLISQGMTTEASQAIQRSRKLKKGLRDERQRDFTLYLIHLLDAYQGLVFFVDWKRALLEKSATTQDSLSQSFYSLTASQGPSEDAIKIMGQRALLGLDQLKDKPGVWDIFIVKSLEIHTYYKEFEEAKVLLTLYRDKNPDNPNSHRLLYEFLEKNSEEFEEAFVLDESLLCLKNVAKLDPANPLVLILCGKLTAKGEWGVALRYSLDLLDSVAWRDSVEAWQCLAHSLTSAFCRERAEKDRAGFLQDLEGYWSCRRDWWPQYHFSFDHAHHTPLTPDATTAPSPLLLAKSLVASVLVGKDCAFCVSARRAMDESSVLHLDAALADLDWDLLRSLAEPTGDSGGAKESHSSSGLDSDSASGLDSDSGSGKDGDSSSGKENSSVASTALTAQWLQHPKTKRPEERPTSRLDSNDSDAESSSASSVSSGELFKAPTLPARAHSASGRGSESSSGRAPGMRKKRERRGGSVRQKKKKDKGKGSLGRLLCGSQRGSVAAWVSAASQGVMKQRSRTTVEAASAGVESNSSDDADTWQDTASNARHDAQTLGVSKTESSCSNDVDTLQDTASNVRHDTQTLGVSKTESSCSNDVDTLQDTASYTRHTKTSSVSNTESSSSDSEDILIKPKNIVSGYDSESDNTFTSKSSLATCSKTNTVIKTEFNCVAPSTDTKVKTSLTKSPSVSDTDSSNVFSDKISLDYSTLSGNTHSAADNSERNRADLRLWESDGEDCLRTTGAVAPGKRTVALPKIKREGGFSGISETSGTSFSGQRAKCSTESFQGSGSGSSSHSSGTSKRKRERGTEKLSSSQTQCKQAPGNDTDSSSPSLKRRKMR